MKIVAGLGCIDDYPLFCEAGADEFFCGYVPYTWTKRYGTTLALNRREVLCYQVQLGAYSELEILAGMREVYKRPIEFYSGGSGADRVSSEAEGGLSDPSERGDGRK